MAKTKKSAEQPPPLIGGGFQDGWARCGRDPGVSHYFLDGRSLCPTSYIPFGADRFFPVGPDGWYTPTTKDCKPCTKALTALIEEAKDQRQIEEARHRAQAEIDAAIGEAERAAEAEQRYHSEHES